MDRGIDVLARLRSRKTLRSVPILLFLNLIRVKAAPLRGGHDGLAPVCPQVSVETISCPLTKCRCPEYIYRRRLY